jgi:hypothetical protein
VNEVGISACRKFHSLSLYLYWLFLKAGLLVRQRVKNNGTLPVDLRMQEKQLVEGAF